MVLAHDIHQITRTRDVQISHNITFDTMLLSTETLQGLNSAGFYKPSPIQLHGIPLGKCGFDLLLEAKSGTGKTAVFAVIALEKLDLRKGLQVVILAPTREIAAQICDVIKHIGLHYEGLQVEVVMGGLPVQEDIEKFKRNVHIVVASPGRFRHLIQDKHIDISSVRLLVLDEADKLVEKSFRDDITHIFFCLPRQKQVIMSSATYTETAKTFIKNYVQNAQHVCPDSNCVLLGVDQKISMVKYNSNIVKQTQIRFQEVLKIFSKMQFKQCLIFCNYQARVSEVHKLLLRAKWPAEQLYGNQEQTERLDALKTLQEYKCRILIATDLAARGIDASNVDLVINFEPPVEWQTYLHRIGRAGRYGSYGMAITILSEGVQARKFHMMLEPMKETINITNLWCNDEISLNKDINFNTCSPTHNTDGNCGKGYTQNEIEKEFRELWEILTSEDSIKNNNLESFENLCLSFDKISNIETFDELLQSFENNHVHTDADINFKHININSQQSKTKNISVKQYLKFKLIECPQHAYEENDKNNAGKSENIESCQAENKATFELNADGKYNIRASCSENGNGDHFSDNSFNNSNNEIEKNDFINESTVIVKSNIRESNKTEKHAHPQDPKKALLDAGLPTEFGKSKKNNKSQFHAKQNRLNRSVAPDRRNTCIQDLLEIQTNSSYRSNNTSDIARKYSNSYKKCINVYDTENYDINLNNIKQKSIHECSTKYKKPTKTMDYVSKNYVNWYRQLKFHTKQIELAMYIDELSKL